MAADFGPSPQPSPGGRGGRIKNHPAEHLALHAETTAESHQGASRSSWRMRLLRSVCAGGVATLADLGVLALCLVLGMDRRTASFPALGAGASVQFFGNRHFAFRASSGCVKRQMLWFGLTEIITLGMNALLYDLLVVRFEAHGIVAVALRALSTNAVFLVWSFPVWHLVFRPSRLARV